ncbi:MAG: hypothetical protein GX295_11545, partial [Syntrophomonadaceae bacterium]|nr:hypothetical protein [Syntrophomonadaceae bacterium]
FAFDSQQGQYFPRKNRVEKPDPKSYAPTKVASIITAFEVEGIDPRMVARQEGFADHREMAEYMKTKGYEWNIHKNNYVKTVGRIDVPEPLQEPNLPILEPIGQPLPVPTVQPGGELPEGLGEYLPFLRYLYENRDELYQLLTGTRDDGIIPRYAIPGEVKTKAIYMSDMVAKLAVEFCKEKNLSQREVMEGALLEYLMKYGFKREVDGLLNNL